MHPRVSILIPHFETPDLVKLCLRSIAKHTQDVSFEVIVIDNDSQDGESLDYLRQVSWIRLIERKGLTSTGASAHKEAVDIGIDAATAPLVLAFHTDTIPIRADWLGWHVDEIERSPRIAAIGTYKLEFKPRWRQWLGVIEDRVKRIALRRRHHWDTGHYIRSHCALYRRDVLKTLGLKYNDSENQTAGLSLHRAIERHGLQARLLPPHEVVKRVIHLNHGTMVLLPELGARRRTIRAGMRRIQEFLRKPEVIALLEDTNLDRLTPPFIARAA